MTDSLRDDVMKYTEKDKTKPTIALCGAPESHKSLLEILTENAERETAKKIFADLDRIGGYREGHLILYPSEYKRIKKKYWVAD